MRMRVIVLAPVITLVIAQSASDPGHQTAPDDAGAPQVVIHRDRFGVPHVFGSTDSATAFGFGYAQAEDNFPRLEDNFIRAAGRRAEVEGEPVGRGVLAGNLPARFGQRLEQTRHRGRVGVE